MNFIAHKIYRTEIARLRDLSTIAPFAMSETRDSLILKVREAGYIQDSETLVNEDSGESLKTFQIIHRLKSQAPRYFRELIFTRAISTLEVFLIEAIRELAKIAPENFKSGEPVSLSREQLFSYSSFEELIASVIGKDCRQLSSGGFQEITKYYRDKLGIDYRPIGPGISAVEEYHDRRHLLVHKLGQTDEAFKHKYNSVAKQVSVDEAYLSSALENLHVFGAELNSLLFQKLLNIPPQTDSTKQRFLFVIEMRDSMPSYLKPIHELSIDGVLISLGSVIIRQIVRGKRMILALETEPGLVDQYLKTLSVGHVSGHISVRYVNPKKHQYSFRER